MKVELELPEWASERHIYVLAGIELAAYKNAESEDWYVKTVRCNSCGECCKNLVPGQYPLKANKECLHLVPDGNKLICGLGVMRPLPCCEGDLEKNKENKDKVCCIRYKKV